MIALLVLAALGCGFLAGIIGGAFLVFEMQLRPGEVDAKPLHSIPSHQTFRAGDVCGGSNCDSYPCRLAQLDHVLEAVLNPFPPVNRA